MLDRARSASRKPHDLHRGRAQGGLYDARIWPPGQPPPANLARIETAHAAELARGVNYAALTKSTDQIPGQLDLLTGQEAQPQ
ncbi:hypothetical protein A4G28_27055 [Mycobacterium ostraviense]|uniref:Uncharacterized protein n=1 Tax=Mycobacterium ostraviense TaxID=2738409 RepID=A0A164E5E0_9MYCO|nr:hypothetical protein A4G28_27055 [Mycobacterium ostraviense]